MNATEKKLNEMLGMSTAELDALGDAYDNDQVEFTAKDTVLDGSPLDYIGTKRETFVLDAVEFQQVKIAARRKGCTKSDIYRSAVREYLDKHDLAHA